MDIIKNFKADRGDLIYGLREARSYYFGKLGQTVKEIQGMDEAWIMLDNYNNYYGVWDNDGEHWHKDEKTTKLDGIASKYNGVGGAAQAQKQAYYERLMGSRYSPDKVIDMDLQGVLDRTTKEKGADFLKTIMSQKGADVQEYFGGMTKTYTVIRRACKFGIGMVASEQKARFPGARIHFLLDGLNLSEVAAKTANSAGVPITYSEVRYVYRNWADLKDIVYFYVRGSRVSAPWDEDYALENIFSSNQQQQAVDWSTPQPAAYIQTQTIAKKEEWEEYEVRRQSKYSQNIPKKSLI